MGEGKLLWLLTLTIFFHSRSLHGNSEGRFASPSNSCFVDDDEECDATIRGFNGSIVGFPGSLFRPLPSRGVFNVEDYGAKGDGTDDSQAFGEAWRAACNSSSSAVLLVPENNKYILKPVAFSGPCRAHMTVMIKGTLEASSNRSDWNVDNIRHWILFDGIRNLMVRGGGTVDGNGHVWWQHSCKRNTSLPCIDAPTALFFSSCKNLVVEDLVVKDSQQMHVAFRRCTNVKASKLTISAPESSPNTDGIHVSGTKSILIKDTIIETGDDCISIVSGSRRVIATRIVCGPGHGISIGSLGANNTRAHVSKVLVDKVILKGTTNGVRIKTWQGGHGYAKHIIFQNVFMHDVQNPIIINQNYCDSRIPCHEQNSAVAVSRVLYRNIKGTSASELAMEFDCSRSHPCRHIVLQEIELVGEGGGPAASLCRYFKWEEIGKIIPAPCA
ncbi:unnamed protein product [Musa banksii]